MSIESITIPKVRLLEAFPYFRGLSPTELNVVGSFLFQKSFAKGETIVTEGDEVEVLYFVASGAVEVFKISAEGKELILWIVKPGDSFNDIPVFEKGLSLANAITLEQTIVYGMCKSHMRFLIEKYPTIALNTLRVFENKMNYLTSLIDDLCFQPVTHRVIKLLLEYAREQANNTNPMPHLTQHKMAARVGTVREMVNRCLKALEA